MLETVSIHLNNTMHILNCVISFSGGSKDKMAVSLGFDRSRALLNNILISKMWWEEQMNIYLEAGFRPIVCTLRE